MKILFVNPSINAGHKALQTLQKSGFAVITSADPQEAWQLVQFHGTSLDLAIIHREARGGWGEPGLELVSKIKRDPLNADLPYIITSDKWSNVEFANHQMGPLGAHAYLRVEELESRLLLVVQAVLGQIPVEQAQSPAASSSPPPPFSPSPAANPPATDALDLALVEGPGEAAKPPETTKPSEATKVPRAAKAPVATKPLEAGNPAEGTKSRDISKVKPLLEDAAQVFAKEEASTQDFHLELPTAESDVSLMSPELPAHAKAAAKQAELSQLLDMEELGTGNVEKPSELSLTSPDKGPPRPEAPKAEAPKAETVIPDALDPEEPPQEARKQVAGKAESPPPPPHPRREHEMQSKPREEEPVELGSDVAAEMPYLFSASPNWKDKLHTRQPLPSSILTPPLGDAVVPGGVAQTPDIETLKKYLLLREQDVLVLSKQLQSARDQIKNLEEMCRQERGKNVELENLAELQGKKLEEFERDKTIAVEALQTELNDLRFQLRAKMDKARVLETQITHATEEMERLKERVRSDIRKIRVREKELENRLEIMKKDSEALIAARENKIMELKRKIDLLEFNMDLLQNQYNREKDNSSRLREQLVKASQAVRVAGGLLDAKGNITGVESETELAPGKKEAS